MNNQEFNFESPTFYKRLKGMLGVDFYRLFHTPLFYIFLGISALIPALILGTSSTEGATQMYTRVWQIIASDDAKYAVSNMGEYANMNMVFIFGGIMVSIFIGHDYKSGYVKQLFTSHPKKQDYMMSKSIVCAFTMMSMCVMYFIASALVGLFSGLSFSVSVSSLIIAILSKMILSIGWASLYTFLNIIFRRYFGISIFSSFFFGTGILLVGLGSIFGNSPILNIFLYGSSVYASLSSTIVTLLVCSVVSISWAVIYNLLGSFILSKSDVY